MLIVDKIEDDGVTLYQTSDSGTYDADGINDVINELGRARDALLVLLGEAEIAE